MAARKRSGMHIKDRRQLGASDEQWTVIDREAGIAGVPWYEWLLGAGLRRARIAELDRLRASTERPSEKNGS